MQDQLQKEYERGFIDGMQEQMRSSVDKAVNAMSKPQVQQRTGNCLLTGVCAAEGHQISKRQYEQKPVAWIYNAGTENRITFIDPHPIWQDVTPLYTAPPQREFIGLTDEEQNQVAWSCGAMSADWLDFARAIEAKLWEKNS